MKSDKLSEFESVAKVTDAKIGAAKPEDKDAKRREAEIAKSASDKAADQAIAQKKQDEMDAIANKIMDDKPHNKA